MAGIETDDEGASPRELLLEAARRNNVELLEEVLNHKHSGAEFLNTSADPVGNTAIHLAATYGSLEVLDLLLDQDGLEVDPSHRIDLETPLHKAVMYSRTEKKHGLEVVEMLIDAGADPRIRNKQKMRPIDLVDPRDMELRQALQKAEYAMAIGNDVVVQDDESDGGAASDSD